MPKEEIVKIENLVFSYDGKVNALDGVSFSVNEGENVSIIGHNGSGKSTLAKILVGLYLSFKGNITLFGESLNKNSLKKIRKKVGIVFQNPDNQFVGSTVADDIAFGLENRCVPTEKMDEIIKEYSSFVDMDEFLDREPITLSGGQKQRVAIAGVLAMKPSLVVFDEATAMLDPKGRDEVASLIFKLKEENPKLTIISVTHDLNIASKGDRVILLENGKLIFNGKPEEIFTNDELINRCGLTLPFSYDFKNELKKAKIELDSKSIKDLGIERES